MAGNEKTLRETLGEVVGETNASNEAAKLDETKEGNSNSQTDETKAGETPVYVSGVDISDVPVEIRPQVEKALKEKSGLLEKGYKDKFQEVATFKKAQQELIDAGLGVDEAKTVLREYISKKNGTVSEKKEAKRLLDTLIESSGPESRESLRQLRTISREEGIAELLEKTGYSNLEDLAKDLKGLKQVQSDYINNVTVQKTAEVNAYLNKVSPTYGKEMIDKYKDNLLDAHIRYNIPIDRLLQSVVPLEELMQSVSRKSTRKEDKVSAVSNPSSGVTASDAIDVKKTPLKGILKSIYAESKRKLSG